MFYKEDQLDFIQKFKYFLPKAEICFFLQFHGVTEFVSPHLDKIGHIPNFVCKTKQFSPAKN